MKKRAAIYGRTSKVVEGSQTVPEQVELCRALAKERGYVVEHVFEDAGRSAYKPGEQRPGWDALQDAIEARSIDVVVTQATSRLTRRGMMGLLMFLAKCEEHGVAVDTAKDGLLPMESSGLSQLVPIVLAATDNEEQHKKSHRLQQGMLTRAQGGRPRGGGARPFGYNRTRVNEEPVLTPHPVEGPMIQQAYFDVLEGRSINGIVREWNDPVHGQPTTRGGKWSRTAVVKTLRRATNASLRIHLGEVLPSVVGNWDRLVSVEDWEKVCVLLDGRRADRKRGPKRVSTYLLAGIARCRCGEVMRSGTGGEPIRYMYRCANEKREIRPGIPGQREHVAISRELADEIVREECIRVLMDAPLESLRGLADTSVISTLYGQLRAVEDRLDGLADAIDKGVMLDRLLPKVVEAEAEKVEIHRKINDARAANLRAALVWEARESLWTAGADGRVDLGKAAKVKVELREKFAEMPMDHQRDLLRATVTVEIQAGNSRDRVVVVPILPGVSDPEYPEGEFLDHAPFGSEVPA